MSPLGICYIYKSIKVLMKEDNSQIIIRAYFKANSDSAMSWQWMLQSLAEHWGPVSSCCHICSTQSSLLLSTGI